MFTFQYRPRACSLLYKLVETLFSRFNLVIISIIIGGVLKTEEYS